MGIIEVSRVHTEGEVGKVLLVAFGELFLAYNSIEKGYHELDFCKTRVIILFWYAEG